MGKSNLDGWGGGEESNVHSLKRSALFSTSLQYGKIKKLFNKNHKIIHSLTARFMMPIGDDIYISSKLVVFFSIIFRKYTFAIYIETYSSFNYSYFSDIRHNK